MALQRKIGISQTGGGQFGRTGRYTLERIVLECAAGGTGGHDPFFRAGDLILAEHLAPDAVGAAGFDFFLEQVHGYHGSLNLLLENHYNICFAFFPLIFFGNIRWCRR